MDKTLTRKRLVKRRNRHAADAGARVKISHPDVRTPEQIKAAREASRPAATIGRQNQGGRTAAASTRNLARPASGSAAKADA